MNQEQPQNTNDEILTCYKHPERETYLRCNKCERPICASCAVLTPTGYRCRECIRSQEKRFDTAQITDYLIAILLSAGISFAGSYVARFLGFFTLLIAPVVSMLISESVLKLTHGRNSTLLKKIVLVSAILASLPLVLLSLGSLYSLIWQAGYTIIMATTLQARMKGLYIG